MINVVVATSANSRYAVRLRSPKPLRASHTRKTLNDIGLRAWRFNDG